MLIILALGLAKTVESIGDIIYGLFQHRERMDRISQSIMIKGISSLIMLGVAVWRSGSVIGGTVSLIASWFLVLFFYDLRKVRDFFPNNSYLTRPSFKLGRLRKLSMKALPLGVASIIMSVNSNIPRYLIDSYLGPGQLGVFAALAYPVFAGSLLMMALGQAVTPRLAASYSERNLQAFRAIISKMILIAIFLAVGGVAIAAGAGKIFLKTIYTTEYSRYVQEFMIVMIAGGISYFGYLLGYALTAAQRFCIQAVSFAVNLMVTLISGLIFVPLYGLMGGAYAMIAGSVCQILIEAIQLISIFKRLQAVAY